MIYADFESILVPENSLMQNPNESYTNYYQKKMLLAVMVINQLQIINYKLCLGNKFSNPFKS